MGKLNSLSFTMQLVLEELTTAEALKEADYTTCFTGKWHLGNELYYPERQGFDINIAGHSAGAPGS